MFNEIFELFCKFARKTQTELHNELIRILHYQYDYAIIDGGDYIIAKGDEKLGIALIAHLDTVYPEKTRHMMRIYRDDTIVWSPDGLGADDRAGIAMIVYLLKHTNFKPHIIFTHDEEKFGVGAEHLANYPLEIEKVKYIIELDRQGQKDCVFYDCDNSKFTQYIESFDFQTDLGTFTDIDILCPEWGVAGVNLSVGYFNEHSYGEYWEMSYWLETYKKLVQMLEDSRHITEPFIFIPSQKLLDYYLNYIIEKEIDKK